MGLVIGDDVDDPLLAVACDHTGREPEVHDVAWSKNASPDVLGRRAWWPAEVAGGSTTSGCGDSWTVELTDPATGDVITASYEIDRLPEPIG